MVVTLDKKRKNNMVFGRIIIIVAVQLFLVFYSFVYSSVMNNEQFNILTIINVFSLMSCIMAFKIDRILLLFDGLYLVTLIALTGYNNSPFIMLLPIYILFSSLNFKNIGAVVSSLVSILAIVIGYKITKDPVNTLSYVLIISSMIVLIALISAYFAERTSKTGDSMKEFNKLNNLLTDNLELGIINLGRNNSINSINRTAEKIFHSKARIIETLESLLNAANNGSNRIVLNDDVLIFIYKIDTPHGTTLVVKDISYEDKIDKLKLINTIASIMAHEIKNPVSSIAGVSELIGSDKEILLDQEQRDKLLGIINRESKRLTNLVEEFLVYSGSEKRKNEEININALIQNSCDNLRVNKEFTEKKLSLNVNNQNDKSNIIFGDFHRLSQAFDNILVNAVQACKKDGVISCNVKNTKDKINITINDDGEGISSEIRGKIFDPFFTTKEKGTGLGLAIVKNIVIAHDGNIDVTNETNGTTFNVTFQRNRSL
ncbi:MAG: ATP-binding protein [bacterium]